MQNFKNQIIEDIRDYQERYPYIQHIEKDEWAFNFWILDKLYHLDEDSISEHITDYNDKGVDCYVWHEDSKDLYIIQNKFYEDGSKLTNEYIQNDFLVRSKGALEKGTYNRSPELQEIFTSNKNDENFEVHYVLYVANNDAITKNMLDGVTKFNEQYAKDHYDCKLVDLDGIQSLYFGQEFKNEKGLSFEMRTVNRNTLMFINPHEDGLKLAVNTKYMVAPVTLLDDLYNEANSADYPLFETNIREYLGQSSVNKKIKNTLIDEAERNNFFFYNNGITMIVDSCGEVKKDKKSYVFTVKNPKIVNGCQTVSTIHETLSSLKSSVNNGEFDNTFVMVKILEIPSSDKKAEATLSFDELRGNIVRYNNNQNSLDEKAFVANQNFFKNFQTEMLNKGFIICLKPSDKNTYLTKYKKADALLKKNNKYLSLFSLEKNKTREFILDLNKLLQIFIAFTEDTPYDAIQNKSKLLVPGTQQYTRVTEFIKDTHYTKKDYLYLILLYMRAEAQQKKSENKKSPNPFYLINTFARYEFKEGGKISDVLKNKKVIDDIIEKYSFAFDTYYDDWVDEHPGKEYNSMIKAPFEERLMDKAVRAADRYMKRGEKL